MLRLRKVFASLTLICQGGASFLEMEEAEMESDSVGTDDGDELYHSIHSSFLWLLIMPW